MTLAAPRFAIPKKKKKVEELSQEQDLVEPDSRPEWQNVQPNTSQFTKLEEIIRKNRFDSNMRLTIHKAEQLNNPWLTYRYEKYRKSLKASGQPDKEDAAFFQISTSPQELAHIAENGLAVGTSINDDLGDSESGVYLSANIDFASPQCFLVGPRGPCMIRVLICKILKGRVNQVGLGSKNLDPTSGYGCHMAKSTGEDSRRRSRVDVYRQQLIYMYEINEDLESVLVPSGVLPYAFVDVAIDTRALTDKRLRLPKFELSSCIYTGRVLIVNTPHTVNFLTNSDETWKPLGIEPTLHVKNFVKWKMALEQSPLSDLMQNEFFGALLHRKEIQLSNGWFVACFILASSAPSVPFTKLIETLSTNQLVGLWASADNVQSLLIPSGELVNRLGLPSHIESALHLIVTQPRSFYSFHQDTLKQIMLASRYPSTNEIVQGFHQQLDDYITEEFDRHINSQAGINACHRFESMSHINKAKPENSRSSPTSILRKKDVPISVASEPIEGVSERDTQERLNERERETNRRPTMIETNQVINPRRKGNDSNEQTEASRDFRQLFSQALGRTPSNVAVTEATPDEQSLELSISTNSLPIEAKKTKTRISDMPMPPAHKKDEYDPGSIDFINEEAVELADEDIENAPSPESITNLDTYDAPSSLQENDNVEWHVDSSIGSPETPTNDEDLRTNLDKEDIPENHVNSLVFRTIYKENEPNEERAEVKQTAKKLEDFLSGFSSRFIDTSMNRAPASENANSPPPSASPSFNEQISQTKAIPLEGEVKFDDPSVPMDTDFRDNFVSNKDVDLRLNLPDESQKSNGVPTNKKLMWPPLTKNQELVYQQGILRNMSEDLQINPGVLHNTQRQSAPFEKNSRPKPSLLPMANVGSAGQAYQDGNIRIIPNQRETAPQPWNNSTSFTENQQRSEYETKDPIMDEGPASPDLEEGELFEAKETVKAIPSSSVADLREIPSEQKFPNTSHFFPSSMKQPMLPSMPGVNPAFSVNSTNQHFRPSLPPQGSPFGPFSQQSRQPPQGTMRGGPKVTIIIPDGMLFIAGTALTPDLLKRILMRLMALNQGPDKYVMHLHHHCNKALQDRILTTPENTPAGQILRGLVTIIERFAQYNVVKILAKHNCDLDNRSSDVIVGCLHQIRRAQITPTTIIFMSNASVGAVFGRRIIQDGFALESPTDLASRLSA
ncbi:unnamed protein product, partial [Mesorhabditis belari]|uniref:DUF3715 domain-containing protein n=1 Tax=Mesorhabditis belari TaxID=2138241 RepID=A0AAF3FR43_9BILA